MPALSKNTRPLLSIVKGKQHASSDDHHEEYEHHTIRTSDTKRRKSTRTRVETSMPTPPGTHSTVSSQIQVINLEDEEAINADPISDDEDFDADPISSSDELVTSQGAGVGTDGFLKRTGVDSPVKSGKGKKADAEFKVPAVDEVNSTSHRKESPRNGLKRSSQDMEPDAEPDWLTGTPKRRKKKGGPVNIHAGPKPPKDLYGNEAKKREKLKKTNSFKGLKASPVKKEFEGPGFKFLDIGHGPGSASADEDFAIAGATQGVTAYLRPGSSSSLSSVRSTPEADDIQILDLPVPKPYKPLVECSYCGEEIDKFVLEEFEDTYKTGGDLAQRWKRRFCNYHKEKEAMKTWRERSYPVIEWAGLERRMRRQNAFLIDVLNDRTPSHYRQALKGKVKPRTKGIRQAWNASKDAKGHGSRPGASVGYYGPRGEKIMTDHIISHLNDEIREQAEKDRLIASSGVEGGVSGFVQAVLVPHLAELLIKEDLKLAGDWSSQARTIIADSCELGEILHPEVVESVVQVDDDDGV